MNAVSGPWRHLWAFSRLLVRRAGVDWSGMLRWVIIAILLIGPGMALCVEPATRPATTASAGALVTWVYDVGSLTRLWVDDRGGKTRLEEISELITSTIAAGQWTNQAAVRAIPASQSLAITQTAAHHAEIQLLLRQIAESSTASAYTLLVHTAAVDPAKLPEELRGRMKMGNALDDADLKGLLAASIAYTPESCDVMLALPMAIRDADGRTVGEIRSMPAGKISNHNLRLTIDGGVVGKQSGMQAHLTLSLDRNIDLELGGVHVRATGRERFGATQDVFIPEARSAILADVPVQTDDKKDLRLYVLLRPRLNTGGVKDDE